MKAYIKKETLVKLIKDNTILTKEVIPNNWQWFNCGDGVVTWDFVILNPYKESIKYFLTTLYAELDESQPSQLRHCSTANLTHAAS